jgi:hypothetical protein
VGALACSTATCSSLISLVPFIWWPLLQRFGEGEREKAPARFCASVSLACVTVQPIARFFAICLPLIVRNRTQSSLVLISLRWAFATAVVAPSHGTICLETLSRPLRASFAGFLYPATALV